MNRFCKEKSRFSIIERNLYKTF